MTGNGVGPGGRRRFLCPLLLPCKERRDWMKMKMDTNTRIQLKRSIISVFEVTIDMHYIGLLLFGGLESPTYLRLFFFNVVKNKDNINVEWIFQTRVGPSILLATINDGVLWFLVCISVPAFVDLFIICSYFCMQIKASLHFPFLHFLIKKF